MLYRSEKLSFVAWGELGVFGKAEFRSDPMTHLVMPPTAAIGIVRSIFWHPEADIHAGEEPRLGIEVSRIEVLSPIRTTSLRLNEVGKLPVRGRPMALHGSNKNIRQTTVVALRDPQYLVEFTYVSRDSGKMVKKAAEIFKRRLSKGQCFRQSCFGRRRYLAHVKEIDGTEKPVDLDLDLGKFPWRVLYTDQGKRLECFDAKVRGGVLEIPSYLEAAEARGEEARL